MKGTHLTLEDRKAIQHGLENNLTRAQIARDLEKSPSTISKEIKLHRKFKLTSAYGRGVRYYCENSGNFKECYGCKIECANFKERGCKRRDKVGVCNRCPDNSKCYLDKYYYRAQEAHEEYLSMLSDSREGVNMTSSQMIAMAQLIGPLLKKGQSVYQILNAHPEIGVCVKTLYNYIEAGIFKDYGIDNFSLRRQVSMRKRKSLKPRKEAANYEGHKYEDYIKFKVEHQSIPTTEMDTVYNDPEGPYIQTFIFENTAVMIGFLHEEKTSASMASTLDMLQETLGDDDYSKLFSLLLTDRGPEFEKHRLFEVNYETGQIRSDIFYCDPQMPSQKPHVENNHNYVRDIIPNGVRLDKLTQEDLNLAFSHINSVPRASLGGKTPYDAFAFFYGEELLEKLHVSKIEKDTVTLMPYLLNLQNTAK